MNAAIIGYGKMGREIERLLVERGHGVGLIVDVDNRGDLDAAHLRGIDVALEFTTPATAYDNIRACIDAGTPVVSGTTGWTDRLDELKTRCKERGGAFFYASNYSLGVNLLFRLNRQLAEMVGRVGGYDVRIEEVHHTQKKDAPSGTALALADSMNEALDEAYTYTYDRSQKRKKRDKYEIGLSSVRGGNIVGEHEVIFAGTDEVITISHTAYSRAIFAKGAIAAAKYLAGKPAGYYDMKDVIG